MKEAVTIMETPLKHAMGSFFEEYMDKQMDKHDIDENFKEDEKEEQAVEENDSSEKGLDLQDPKAKTNFRKKKANTKIIAGIAVMSALATVIVTFGRIPVPFPQAPWLKYDPKDIVIVISGFVYGPLAAVVVSVVSSLIEAFTVSTTQFWGFLMNVISSIAYALPSALLYKKIKSKVGAILGMVLGILVMTTMMLLFNIIITPIYTGMPREKVFPLLASVFLPFNLLKGSLNTGITMLIYKPLIRGLRAANVLPKRSTGSKQISQKTSSIISIVITIFSLLLIVAGILAILHFNKII